MKKKKKLSKLEIAFGKKKIIEFIDGLLQKTGKIGKYDQKI